MELEQRTAQLRMQSSERAMPFLCRQMEDLQVRRHVHAERAIQESQQLILQPESRTGKREATQPISGRGPCRCEAELHYLSDASYGQATTATRNQALLQVQKCFSFIQAGDLTPIPRFGDCVQRNAGEFLHPMAVRKTSKACWISC